VSVMSGMNEPSSKARPDVEGMSFDEAVAWLEKHEDELEWREAKIEGSPAASTVISVRFKPEELDAAVKTAQSAGVSLSAFIRQSTLRSAGLPEPDAKARPKEPDFRDFLDKAAKAYIQSFGSVARSLSGGKRKTSDETSSSGGRRPGRTPSKTKNVAGERLAELKETRKSGQRGGKPHRRSSEA
jgi:hypothetical protein